MTSQTPFDIFLTAPPGLEAALLAEVTSAGFSAPKQMQGGVTISGDWSDVYRANLVLRGAGQVLARIASFRAMHLAQLDKRSRKVDWASVLRKDTPVRVEATCRKSRIYHAGAAAQRVSKAIAEGLGAPISDGDGLRVMVRIEDDLCTISLDCSGLPLHKRGHKQAVGKAPLRETMAALLLRQAGFDGTEPVLDPMCGSGTLPIEAAEIAMGLNPGRTRHFAFEDFANFDADLWSDMRAEAPAPLSGRFHAYGSDRNTGAIEMSRANAARAGVDARTTFSAAAISDCTPPEGPAGLVICNPPYGARIGNKKLLFALYGSFGKIMAERFSGWRVAFVTSDEGLAKATQLPFLPFSAPIAHGGLKVRLYQTAALD